MAESRQLKAIKDYREVRMLRNTEVWLVERGVSEDRLTLEMGEARTLAHNFKDRQWLEKALKVSERIYGKGSAERIKTYMREIWKTEMCK